MLQELGNQLVILAELCELGETGKFNIILYYRLLIIKYISGRID